MSKAWCFRYGGGVLHRRRTVRLRDRRALEAPAVDSRAVAEAAPEDGVKERLRRYSDLLDEIDMQRLRLDMMRADMGGLRSPSYDPQGSAQTDPDGVHRKAARAISLEERIEADVLRAEAEHGELERMVRRIPRAMERAVIRMRYFDRMSWDEVAFSLYGDRADYLDMAFEYRQRVYRRHREALLSLALVDADESIVRRSA